RATDLHRAGGAAIGFANGHGVVVGAVFGEDFLDVLAQVSLDYVDAFVTGYYLEPVLVHHAFVLFENLGLVELERLIEVSRHADVTPGFIEVETTASGDYPSQ